MIANRTYHLMPYNPGWADVFRVRAAILRELFGANAVSIEHVGSTAVPGMSAKPQIDILITVNDLNAVRDLYSAMEAELYTPRGNYTGIGEEYFTHDAQGHRIASIHVLPVGHVEAVEMIQFRDYLRAHDNERDAYMALKLQLAKEFENDYPAYVAGKKTLINELRRKAREQ